MPSEQRDKNARTAAIALTVLLALIACKARSPTHWIGLDRASAACSEESWDVQTCVAGGRRYTCIRSDDHYTWQCAALLGDHSAEARP